MLSNIENLYFWIYIAAMAVVFIAVHFILGNLLKLYDKTNIFDNVFHFLISFLFFAPLGFWIAHRLTTNPVWLATIFAFCFAVTINTIWEIFEFTCDYLFKTNMQRWKDTTKSPRGAGLIDAMWDLISCLSGALVASTALFLIATFG